MNHLRLYISGNTPTAAAQIDRLRTLLRQTHGDDYTLDVLNIFDHPEEAYEDAIVATPTLIKRLPPPAVQIIGNLQNMERVLVGVKCDWQIKQ